MRTVGIIAEYNPFHTGHKYHIEKAKELADADYAVVVMSPDFVQRGEPAIFDKYTRARMALQCGADLVLELPLCYAAGSAEYFAEGAVRMLDSLGVVDALCFGAELNDTDTDAAIDPDTDTADRQTGYTDAFQDMARLLLEEPEPYKEALKAGLRRGFTFPKARTRAAAQATGKTKELLSGPNNILGVEYCKALQKFHSSITPVPLPRTGSRYSDQTLEGDYCSARAIRGSIRDEFRHYGVSSFANSTQVPERHRELSRHIPAGCAELFWNACKTPIFPDELLPVLTQKLVCTHGSPESAADSAKNQSGNFFGDYTDCSFSGILDISPALSDRIEKLRFDCVGKSFDEIVALIKTKQITETHVRRALLHLVLDIRKDDVVDWRKGGGIFYAHLLGFRQDAAPLLHEIKQKSAVPLLSKAAHAPRLLSGPGLQMWSQDVTASHLYRSLRTLRYGTPFQSEYQISPISIASEASPHEYPHGVNPEQHMT